MRYPLNSLSREKLLLVHDPGGKIERKEDMNIRKNIDYSEMNLALDLVMGEKMPQMEQYCMIGKAISQRTEKGAAVAAAKYLAERYPDTHGFSPRNVRRMRDFYRTYENHPALLTLALQIGWTQNVVIMEADLSMELREWYLRAAKQFGWSKAELTENITNNVHEKIVLVIENDLCYSEEQKNRAANNDVCMVFDMVKKIRHLIQSRKYLFSSKEGNKRRWPYVMSNIHPQRSDQAKVSQHDPCGGYYETEWR